MERDLHICAKLKSMPVIWSLLQAIASYRPALCYCSVILRAVAATLLVVTLLLLQLLLLSSLLFIINFVLLIFILHLFSIQINLYL